MKIAVLISGRGSNLQALIDAQAESGWPAEIVLVISNEPGAKGLDRAEAAGIAAAVTNHRDFDGRVARTADRPIPSGAVSVRQAVLYMGALLLIGLAILLQFNRFAVIVGAASLVLIVIYPFMKRITYWPQFFLGLAFNWGALLGWAAGRGMRRRWSTCLALPKAGWPGSRLPCWRPCARACRP